MDASERIKMVKCMEFICRQINDEEIFDRWITDGVADGDIPYGETELTENDSEVFYYIRSDDAFSFLMHTFLNIMAQARKSGGLYCDGVVDKSRFI